MPILLGLIVGYIYSSIVGIVDFSKVKEAAWFALPDFLIPGVHYEFNITSTILLAMVPIVIVTISEHIGHQLVLGKVVNRNYIKDPGLHRSLLGDGLGTFVSALIGGPPKTTYGENIGVLAITRVFSVYVILGAAVLSHPVLIRRKSNGIDPNNSNSSTWRNFHSIIRDYCIKWS